MEGSLNQEQAFVPPAQPQMASDAPVEAWADSLQPGQVMASTGIVRPSCFRKLIFLQQHGGFAIAMIVIQTLATGLVFMVGAYQRWASWLERRMQADGEDFTWDGKCMKACFLGSLQAPWDSECEHSFVPVFYGCILALIITVDFVLDPVVSNSFSISRLFGTLAFDIYVIHAALTGRWLCGSSEGFSTVDLFSLSTGIPWLLVWLRAYLLNRGFAHVLLLMLKDFMLDLRTSMTLSSTLGAQGKYRCIRCARRAGGRRISSHHVVKTASAKTGGVGVDDETITILRNGDVRLLSARWLLSRPKGWRIERNQTLLKESAEAFIDCEEAAELVQLQAGVVVISYGWISPTHPDPDSFHLEHLLQYLELHLGASLLSDVGVFWDFAALPQHERSPDELESFKRGLGAINVLYGSQFTYVLQLKEMPDLEIRPYDVRGWCTFEESISQIHKDSGTFINLLLAKDLLQRYQSWQFKLVRVVRGQFYWLAMTLSLLAALFAVWTADKEADMGSKVVLIVWATWLLPQMLANGVNLIRTGILYGQLLIWFVTFVNVVTGNARYDVVFAYMAAIGWSFTTSRFVSRMFADLVHEASAAIQPPIHPDQMAAILSEKTFTNGADREMVIKKYTEFFHQVASTNTHLDFQVPWLLRMGGYQEGSLRWRADECKQLAKVLPLFAQCEQLVLTGHSLQDEGLEAILEVLPQMMSLRGLILGECDFTEIGLQSLGQALPRLRLEQLVLPQHLAWGQDVSLEKSWGGWKGLYGFGPYLLLVAHGSAVPRWRGLYISP